MENSDQAQTPGIKRKYKYYFTQRVRDMYALKYKMEPGKWHEKEDVQKYVEENRQDLDREIAERLRTSDIDTETAQCEKFMSSLRQSYGDDVHITLLTDGDAVFVVIPQKDGRKVVVTCFPQDIARENTEE